MPIDKEVYLPIKEIADRAGVTVQAVYRRIKTDLSAYVVEEDGVKYAHKSIINRFSPAGIQAHDSESLITIEALRKTIEMLQKQVEIKDKQIESLFNMLQAEQQSTLQAQLLHHGALEQLHALTEPTPGTASADEQGAEPATVPEGQGSAQDIATQTPSQNAAPTQEGKRSFWAWLFG